MRGRGGGVRSGIRWATKHVTPPEPVQRQMGAKSLQEPTVGMAESKPLVSIIVPSYNQGQFIRRTIESILSQDYRPLEIIVIDGASSDETLSILREFDSAPELTWVSEPDSGVVEAVNKGLSRARGQIGAIQSSDDFYLPGAVSAAVEALESDLSLAFSYGDVAKVDALGKRLSVTNLPAYSLEGILSLEGWIPQPATFFRLQLARTLGCWRNEVPYAADTDLWLRMAVRAPARKLDRVMAERSMHDAQRDRQGKRIVADYGRCIDDLLATNLLDKRQTAAARAGKLLMANRYGYTDTGLLKTIRLWRAAASYPTLLARLPSASLVPGWYWIRSLARRALKPQRSSE